MSEQNKMVDESGDKKYFIITPRIVRVFSRSPYDLALWEAVKDIAGDSGECYLSTEELAILSGMSAGKASESRQYWIGIGFLKGEIRKDPGYPQPVWHLTVPDLWQKNIEWCENHPKISERIAFIKSLHQVKPSPGEGGVSPGEGGTPPHEGKKNKRKTKKNISAQSAPKANQIPEIVLYREVTSLYPSSEVFSLVVESIAIVKNRLGRDVTKDDLLPFRQEWVRKGYNRLSINWLEWAETGSMPVNGTWKSRREQPAPAPVNQSQYQLALQQARSLVEVP